MTWHPTGVTRTSVSSCRVNFSEILNKKKGILFELAGNSSYPSSSQRSEMTEKWSEIQGK